MKNQNQTTATLAPRSIMITENGEPHRIPGRWHFDKENHRLIFSRSDYRKAPECAGLEMIHFVDDSGAMRAHATPGDYLVTRSSPLYSLALASYSQAVKRIIHHDSKITKGKKRGPHLRGFPQTERA